MEELIIENQMLREKVNQLQKKLLFFEEFVEEKEVVEEKDERNDEVVEVKIKREEKKEDNVFSSKKPKNFYTSLRPLTKKEIQYIHRYIQYLKLLK